MTSTVENIFSALSSGDDSCTTPKSVDYLAVAPGRFLVFVDRDGYDEVLAAVRPASRPTRCHANGNVAPALRLTKRLGRSPTGSTSCSTLHSARTTPRYGGC